MSEPIRTCIGCRQRYSKRGLLRIALSSSGEIEIDLNQNLEGRGAYICSKEECLKIATNLKEKKLNRTFRAEISSDSIVKLKSKLVELHDKLSVSRPNSSRFEEVTKTHER